MVNSTSDTWVTEVAGLLYRVKQLFRTGFSVDLVLNSLLIALSSCISVSRRLRSVPGYGTFLVAMIMILINSATV